VRPSYDRIFPEIASGRHGTVDYAYNAQTGLGVLRMTNVPYMVASGTNAATEYAVSADAAGLLRQSLSLVLAADGTIVDDPLNSYEVYGSIEAGGRTFDGLLLKGTPVAFGAVDLDPLGLLATDVFDASIRVSGGLLADYFGPIGGPEPPSPAYLRFRSDGDSTFHGRFDEDFAGGSPTSFLGSTYPFPAPIPEPAAVFVLLAGGLAAAWRRGRRP
jgi:hypothetical protein